MNIKSDTNEDEFFNPKWTGKGEWIIPENNIKNKYKYIELKLAAILILITNITATVLLSITNKTKHPFQFEIVVIFIIINSVIGIYVILQINE